MKKNHVLICIALSILAGVFLFMPVYSAFIKGVFKWHLSQPALWKDAIELFIYLIVSGILGIISGNKKGFIVLIVSAIYLLSVGTLTECLVSYVYVEIIILIGRSLLAAFLKGKSNSTGINFLFGSIIWGSLAILMSLLGMGGIQELRILTVVLTLLAIINYKNEISLNDLLLIKYIRYMNNIEIKEFGIHMFFICVMLISCARVNTFLDSDSSWYALYTDKCLFGENSFYDFLGYTDFVYYYPKFKELLMAPLTGLGQPGYLISGNLWILVLCVLEVFAFLKEQIKGSEHQVLSTVFLMFSSVCTIGIAGTAKSDTLSYFYMLMMIICVIKYFRTKEASLFWWAASSGIMSYTVKYTSFLFSTIVFVLLIISVIFCVCKKKMKFEKPELLHWVLIFFSCFIFLGILYRTWKLTGFPTYRMGKGFWDTIGFQAKPYFDIDVDVDYKLENVFLISRIYQVLFDVGNAGKITAQWTGNYYVFFFICLLCLFRKRKNNGNNDFKLLYIISVLFSVVSVYFLVTMTAPDGNYFSVAVITITCFIFISITKSVYWDSYKKWFTAITHLFLILNIMFVFVTHPSWGTATRFSYEPISLYKTEEEKLERKSTSINYICSNQINARLKELGGNEMVLADGSTGMCSLDARIELANCLLNNYISGANINSYQDFIAYINYVGLNGFIIAKDESAVETFSEYVRQYITEYGCIEQIDTEKYCYYRIK